MKILFITIPFFEYISKIKEQIAKEMNAQVDVVYCDTPIPSYMIPFDKGLSRKISKYYNKKSQVEEFKKKSKINYDYIFVLVGRNVDVESLTALFKIQRKAKKILYVWDDVARINTFNMIKNLFDVIYSFDSEDCKRYGFDFLPLFYCDDYCYDNEKKDIDFSCFGGLHPKREKYLNNICKYCNKYGFTNYFHLKTATLTLLKEFVLGKRHKLPYYIKTNEISMTECSGIVKRSVCAVDMPHSTQSGLTIRSIEALASQTKLITTNKAIKEYDFYNENNILVTDSDCSNLTEEFIRRPYVKIDDSIVEKYSLSSWVRTIFKGD